MKINSSKAIPITTISLLILMFTSSNVLAGDSANFTISGKFLPTACNIVLSKNNIDVGSIKYGELETQNTTTKLMEKRWAENFGLYSNIEKTTLTVECDNLASVGFTVTDNNSSYAPLNFIENTGISNIGIEGADLSHAFGLKSISGLANSSKLGGYFFEFTKALVVGAQGKDINKDFNTGLKDSKISNAGWIKKKVPGDLTLSKFWTYIDSDDPVKAKTFKVDFKPNLFFYYDSTQRDLIDEITFEGSATFTIFYI
ncbi:MAG: hypothetical protein ACTS8U_00500 [Arsenophonus sp. ET-DL9-MAG3]